MMDEALYKRLRRLRLARGLTAKSAAESLDVATSTYREWENGRKIIGEPYAKMAALFGVSLSVLLLGKKSSQEGIFLEINAIETHLQALKKELTSFF